MMNGSPISGVKDVSFILGSMGRGRTEGPDYTSCFSRATVVYIQKDPETCTKIERSFKQKYEVPDLE